MSNITTTKLLNYFSTNSGQDQFNSSKGNSALREENQLITPPRPTMPRVINMGRGTTSSQSTFCRSTVQGSSSPHSYGRGRGSG
ncbi:hypothetical protein H1Q59_08860 [Holosporaceae bacterium 'Namur']|nr:hypothetical protein [Holosporaceae bacterium 'Namur']